MVPMTTVPHLKWLMQAMPARWGFEGAIVPERMALVEDPAWLIKLGNNESSPGFFVEGGTFKCAIAQVAGDHFAGAWEFTTYENTWMPYAVLGGSTVLLLVILCITLKSRDPV
jgi:hypothetical protein